MNEITGRKRLAAMVAAVVAATSAVVVVTSTPSAAVEVPPDPLAFGAYVQPRGGQSERQAVEAFEDQIGRQLEVVRVFERWEQPFPDSYHTWLRDSGHSIVLSVKPYRSNGGRVTWSSIANASPGSQVDSEIRSWARRIRDYGVPVHVTLHHEPESSTGLGTSDEFISAWRHWVDVFRDEGVTNAEFMWIMTDYSFFVSTSDRRWAPKWYPGDEWVDGIAADAYNWHTCRSGIDNPWKSLEQIIEPFRDFGAQHPDQALWLTEFGGVEDSAVPGRKAAWFEDATELFKQPGWEQFDGVLYFNNYRPRSQYDCNWLINSSSRSLNGFRDMAQDPFYDGSAFQDEEPGTTTTTTTTTTTLPDPPAAGCQVEWNGSTATLQWAETGGTDVIRRNGSWLATPPPNPNTYVDVGAPAGSSYLIRAWAGGARVDIPCTESGPGGTTTTTTTTTLPDPPAAGCQVEWNGSTATLQWAETGGTDVIRRNGSWLATPPPNPNTYVDVGAPAGSSYLIRAWAGGAPVDIPCT